MKWSDAYWHTLETVFVNAPTEYSHTGARAESASGEATDAPSASRPARASAAARLHMLVKDDCMKRSPSGAASENHTVVITFSW